MASGANNHTMKDEEGFPREEFQVTSAEAAGLARVFGHVKTDR